MRVAASTARDTEVFCVPTILYEDEPNLRFAIRPIDGFQSLFRVVRKEQRLLTLARRAGEALGIIHKQVWESKLGTEQGLFHGDFDLHNLGLDNQGRLFILDWDRAPGLNRLTMSPHDLDIGMLQFSLVTAIVRYQHSLSLTDSVLEGALDSYCQILDVPREFDLLLEKGQVVSRELAKPMNLPVESVTRGMLYLTARLLTMHIICSVGSSIP